MFARLNNIRLKTVGTAFAAFTVLAAAVVIGSSLYTINATRQINDNWSAFENGPAFETNRYIAISLILLNKI
jgi:hypothetical protein